MYSDSQNRMTEIADSDIQMHAPSAFTEQPHSRVSSAYQQIKTLVLVNIMRDQGWKPVFATESKVRDKSRKGFQKHLIVFKKREGGVSWLQCGEQLYPEILLINGHDASTAYNLSAGLFRGICGNGLIVADSTFESVRIRHMGFDPEKLVRASYQVIENVPQIAGKVNRFSQIDLTQFEKTAFARCALIAKHNPDTQEEATKLNPQAVLRPRRSEDRKPDLWTTYNVLQENLVKGHTRERIGKNRTREIKAIDKNVSLNKALWMLTEQMASIKTNQS